MSRWKSAFAWLSLWMTAQFTFPNRKDCLFSDTFTNKGLIFFHLAQYEISTFYYIFVYSFVGTLVQIFVWISQLYPFLHFFLGAFIFFFFFLMWQTSIYFKKLTDPFYMRASIYFTLSFFVCKWYFKLMYSWFTIFY